MDQQHEEPLTPETTTEPQALSPTLPSESETKVEKSFFQPPLSVQRYQYICELVLSTRSRSIMDLGCGDCRLIQKLKHIDCVESIVGVDVDTVALNMAKCKCRPLNADYICPRSRPLSIELYDGDITKYDARISRPDMAVLVEVVEHLYPDVLVSLPTTLFGLIRPHYVVVTTPNAEFNVLFENFSGMRHWDHKFEWTRAEFQTWCTNVSEKFDYAVEFSGVGVSNSDIDVGFCTQIAMFSRLSESAPQCVFEENQSCQEQTSYTLVCSETYPYRTERRHLIDNVVRCVETAISKLVAENVLNKISINRLFTDANLSELCTEPELVEILIGAFYRLSADRKLVLVDMRDTSSDEDSGRFEDAEDDSTSELFRGTGYLSTVEIWD